MLTVERADVSRGPGSVDGNAPLPSIERGSAYPKDEGLRQAMESGLSCKYKVDGESSYVQLEVRPSFT